MEYRKTRFAQKLVARCRFALAYPQPLPLAALLLIVGAAAVHFHLLPAREASIELAERQLAAAERVTRRIAAEQRKDGVSPEAAKQDLLARFPRETALNETLGSLLDLVRSSGLDLVSGDYRLTMAAEGLLAQYVITLPLKGDYLALRRYLLEVREKHSGIAIDDVASRRDSIGNPALETQLRLIVFVRREPL
jgi:hypothetical protein